MKKLVLIAAAFLLTLPAAFAQKGLHFGVLGGNQGIYQINKEDSDSPNFRAAFGWGSAFGVSFGYHFKDNVGVGTEILYSVQGVHLEGGGFQRVNYVRIPVLLNFNSNPESVVMFVGKVGPEMGILTKSAVYLGGLNLGETTPLYSKVEIAAVLGLGIAFNIKERYQIGLGLRLDYGLTDAIDQDNLGVIENPGYISIPNVDATYGNPEFISTSGLQVDPVTGERGKTSNAAAMIEFSFKYKLPMGR